MDVLRSFCAIVSEILPVIFCLEVTSFISNRLHQVDKCSVDSFDLLQISQAAHIAWIQIFSRCDEQIHLNREDLNSAPVS